MLDLVKYIVDVWELRKPRLYDKKSSVPQSSRVQPSNILVTHTGTYICMLVAFSLLVPKTLRVTTLMPLIICVAGLNE